MNCIFRRLTPIEYRRSTNINASSAEICVHYIRGDLVRKEVIIEKGQQEKSVPIHDMDAGLYIINIRDAKGFRQRTIVIQKW